MYSKRTSTYTRAHSICMYYTHTDNICMYIYYSLVAVLFALSFCIGLMLSHNSIFCSQHHNQCKGTVVFSIHYFNIPLGFIRRLSNKSDVHVFVPNKIQATRKEMQEHNAFCDFANSVSISS